MFYDDWVVALSASYDACFVAVSMPITQRTHECEHNHDGQHELPIESQHFFSNKSVTGITS